MNASLQYDLFQKMHSACSRMYPIANDFLHNVEEDAICKLPGLKSIVDYNTVYVYLSGDYFGQFGTPGRPVSSDATGLPVADFEETFSGVQPICTQTSTPSSGEHTNDNAGT